MSHENVERTRRAFEAFNQDGIEAFTNTDLWPSEIVFDFTPTGVPGLGVYRGYDEVRRFFEEDWFGAFPFEEWEVEVERLIDHRDQVISLCRQRRRGTSSGAAGALEFAVVGTFHDGAMVRSDFYLDWEEALKAAGLSESARSQENIERFRRSLDAFNRGDFEAWLATIHPDVTFAPIRASVEGVYRGHAGVRRFFVENRETFESFHLEYTDIRDLGGGRLLVIGTVHLRARGSGIETDVPTAAIATERDGLLIDWRDFGDSDKALEAAGLSE